jgi:hypothetical protein
VEITPGAATRDRIAAGLAARTLETARHRKGRDVLEDVRPVIRSIDVHDDTTVDMELHTQPRGAKPGEVLAAIGGITEVRALRTHQWIERDGARLEPLDADTITVGFATADGGFAGAAGSDSSRPYAPEGAYVTREGINVRSGTSRGRDEREECDERDGRGGVRRAAAGGGRDPD